MLTTLLALTVSLAGGPAPDDLHVQDLRCEYLKNPLGLDTPHPRLSWSLECNRRGARPTAYQLQVTTNTEAEPDLWDTGKVSVAAAPRGGRDVAGSASAVAPAPRGRRDGQDARPPDAHPPNTYPTLPYVEYAGKPLASRTRAHWRVRVWDEKDQPSAYSDWATFEIAFLDPSDWKAKWISSEPQRHVNPAIRDATWIWTTEGDPKVTTSEGERFFCKRFDLPDTPIDEAKLLVTADDEYDALINGHPIGSGKWPVLGEYDAKLFLRLGARNAIAIQAKNLSGSAGLIAKLILKSNGQTHEYITDKTWKYLEKPIEDWPTAKLDDSKWPSAREVTKFGGTPWGQLDQPPEGKPAPYLRRVFELTKPVRSARAYICGLGYYRLHINGEDAASMDNLLQPAFTRYDRRVLYNTLDVAKKLKPGKNAVGVILGNGWYNFLPKAVWNFDKAPWRSDSVLLLQLEVTYEDGSREQIMSDETWKWADGPLLSNQLFIGDVYDARREQDGWDKPEFDDQSWHKVHARQGPAGKVAAQAMPPIRYTGMIPSDSEAEKLPESLNNPPRVTEPKKGIYVFDMGQAFAGIPALYVSGPAGTVVTLKFGERLNKDGTVDQRDICPYAREIGFQTDKFIMRGGNSDVWVTRFGYYGYRYAEVQGLPSPPDEHTLAGLVMHTDYEHVGTFECSNKLLNQIYHNTLWSYGANFYGYPTDCPHREKNGWTGDAHLAAEQAMYNFNNVPAYEKWMNDFKDEQRDSGELPGIVPTAGWGYNWGNGPAWDSAYVLIPWYLYAYYGDLRVLEEHYDRMKRYVDYLTSRAKDHIVSIGLGDWVPVKTQTPVEITSTAYYYIDTMIVSKTARLLGKTEDAQKYTSLADAIRDAYHTHLANKEGLYTGSQTALSCVLYQGIARDDEVSKLMDALVTNVKGHDNHLDCGILGTKYLLHALTDNGRADLAYAVAAQKTFPSWGHWIEQGATTLWEQWGGEASRMHIMLGDVSAWFFSGLAGIAPDPDHPGFEHFFIKPNPVGDLTWARADYNSIRGLISSSWKRDGRQFTLDVQIPPGTTATLSLPVQSAADVKEGSAPAEHAEGVRGLPTRNNRSEFELQSGTYRFIATSN